MSVPDFRCPWCVNAMYGRDDWWEDGIQTMLAHAVAPDASFAMDLIAMVG